MQMGKSDWLGMDTENDARSLEEALRDLESIDAEVWRLKDAEHELLQPWLKAFRRWRELAFGRKELE